MPGAVLAVHVAVGDDGGRRRPGRHARGDEDGARRRRAVAGRVTELRVAAGDQVARGQVLATIEA